MPLAEHLGPILIAVISGAGTVLVTMMKIRGDKENGIPGAYQGIMQEMKAWHATQIEQLEKQVGQQGERIERQGRKIDGLEREMQSWKAKFREAVDYIRRLRAVSRDHDALPPVPESLRDDIDE